MATTPKIDLIPAQFSYEQAWQFLIGMLSPAQLGGQGINAAQLAEVMDLMLIYAIMKSPQQVRELADIRKALGLAPTT